jgi:hypothetical protein
MALQASVCLEVDGRIVGSQGKAARFPVSIYLDVHVIELGNSEEEHAFLGEMRGVMGNESGDRAEGIGAVDEID